MATNKEKILIGITAFGGTVAIGLLGLSLAGEMSKNNSLEATLIAMQSGNKNTLQIPYSTEQIQTEIAKQMATAITHTPMPTSTETPIPTTTAQPTDTEAPTQTSEPSATETSTPMMMPTEKSLKNEVEVPPEAKDEAVSLNELLSSSLTDPKEFAKHYKRIQELAAAYGKPILDLSPLFVALNQAVQGDQLVVFGVNAVSKTDTARLRLHFDGTNIDRLMEQQSIFESNTFMTDSMGKPRLGFNQNPASQDVSGLFVGSTKDNYLRSALFAPNADSLGVAIFEQNVAAVKLAAKNSLFSLTPDQINDAAYQVTYALQATEWQEVDGNQPIIQKAGNNGGSLNSDAPVPVTGEYGQPLDLIKTRVLTCRVQNLGVESGRPADQRPVVKSDILVQPQDGLTKYSELNSDSNQASFFVLDIEGLKAETGLTTPSQFAAAILRHSRQLSVYGDKNGMQSIPNVYEVSPLDKISDRRTIEFYYMLCGIPVPGGSNAASIPGPQSDSTPVIPDQTPPPGKTPIPEMTPAPTNNPITAPTWTPGVPPNPTAESTVVPTQVKNQPTQPPVVSTPVTQSTPAIK